MACCSFYFLLQCHGFDGWGISRGMSHATVRTGAGYQGDCPRRIGAGLTQQPVIPDRGCERAGRPNVAPNLGDERAGWRTATLRGQFRIWTLKSTQRFNLYLLRSVSEQMNDPLYSSRFSFRCNRSSGDVRRLHVSVVLVGYMEDPNKWYEDALATVTNVALLFKRHVIAQVINSFHIL